MVKKLLLATRPWSFPASVLPFLVGALAVSELRPLLLALMLPCVILLHAAQNLLSDYMDHRIGLDEQAHPGCGALVNGSLSPKEVLALAAGCASVALSLGGISVLLTSLSVLILGVVMLILGASYSWSKRVGLNSLLIFMIFGPLSALAGWLTQGGALADALRPITLVLPIAILVCAILFSNNWRDADHDRALGLNTFFLPARFGWVGYCAHLIGALIFGICLVPHGWVLLVFAPWILRLCVYAKPADRLDLDGRTAQFLLPFGVVYLILI